MYMCGVGTESTIKCLYFQGCAAWRQLAAACVVLRARAVCPCWHSIIGLHSLQCCHAVGLVRLLGQLGSGCTACHGVGLLLTPGDVVGGTRDMYALSPACARLVPLAYQCLVHGSMYGCVVVYIYFTTTWNTSQFLQRCSKQGSGSA